MSNVEVFGTRAADLLYSRWHRPSSAKRFMSAKDADLLAMVDIDAMMRCQRWVEACKGCWEPLALIETALENHQSHKTGAALRKLALRAGVEAFIALITPTENRDDIQSFRVKQIAPTYSDWTVLSPQQYADALLRVRARATTCTCAKAVAA